MKFTLLFIVLFQYSNIVCQDIQIKAPIIHTYDMDSMFIPNSRRMEKVLDTGNYILKTSALESIAIFESKLNFTQIFFENIKYGKINDSLASKIIKIRKYENINFSNFENDDKIAILIGKTNNATFVITPDYNNNNDFTDDIGYLYTSNVSNDCLLKMSAVKFDNLDYAFGDGGPNETYSITFDIVIKFNASSIAESSISLLSRDIWIGKIELSELKIEFFIYPIQIPKQTRNFGNSQVIYGNIYAIKDFKNSEKTWFEQSIDTLFTKTYGIVLDSVNNSGQCAYFTIKTIKEEVYLDSQINKLKGQNLKTSVIEKFVPNDKITIIDFWATWCAPCIAQHKILQKLYNNKDFSDTYTLKGILLDNLQNKNKAIKYIEKENFRWENFFIDTENPVKELQLLRIKSLPTYLVIDKQSRILLRTNSFETLIKYIDRN